MWPRLPQNLLKEDLENALLSEDVCVSVTAHIPAVCWLHMRRTDPCCASFKVFPSFTDAAQEVIHPRFITPLLLPPWPATCWWAATPCGSRAPRHFMSNALHCFSGHMCSYQGQSHGVNISCHSKMFKNSITHGRKYVICILLYNYVW